MSTRSLTESDITFLQLGDSFFPTGMYSTSSGLENFFYAGKVKTKEKLRELLEVYLVNQIGPADCVALGNAYRAAKDGNLNSVLLIDEQISTMKLVAEVRDASIRSGVQMLKCVSEFRDDSLINEYLKAIKNGLATGIYPVSLAVVLAAFDVPRDKAALVLVYSFLVSIVGAALRLGMIDHVAGQTILDELKPIMLKVINDNIDRPAIWMRQFVPEIDLNQIWHETSNNRMFIT